MGYMTPIAVVAAATFVWQASAQAARNEQEPTAMRGREASSVLEEAPYQPDEYFLDAVVDVEDRTTGDVDRYHEEVLQAALDLASGAISREEYWEEIQQARVLLEPDDGLVGYGYFGNPYSDVEHDAPYSVDEHGAFDSRYEWDTDDAGWDGWYELKEIPPPRRE